MLNQDCSLRVWWCLRCKLSDREHTGSCVCIARVLTQQLEVLSSWPQHKYMPTTAQEYEWSLRWEMMLWEYICLKWGEFYGCECLMWCLCCGVWMLRWKFLLAWSWYGAKKENYGGSVLVWSCWWWCEKHLWWKFILRWNVSIVSG